MNQENQSIETVAPPFNIDSLDVVNTAISLDLKHDDLENIEIQRKIETIYNKYISSDSREGFSSFVRKLNSKIGYSAGVHPLDRIYSYLLVGEKSSVAKKHNKEKNLSINNSYQILKNII